MTLEELSAIAAEMPAGHRFFVQRARLKDLWPDPVWRKPSDVDDHLTVAQRAEQWAHRHGVRTWEQHDPVGVMIEKLTPTGRDLKRLIDFETFSREDIQNPAVIIVTKDVDFAELEMRYLAAMNDPGVTALVLDIETDHPPCRDLDLRFYAISKVEKPPAPTREHKPPPSYLKHDPTKRHGRGKRP